MRMQFVVAGMTIVALTWAICGTGYTDDPKDNDNAMKIHKLTSRPASPDSTASQPAREMIDNPQYESWVKFKVGTSITVENTYTQGDRTSTNESTFTLKEVTADKIYLDLKGSRKIPGKDEPYEFTHQVPVPAKMPKSGFQQNPFQHNKGNTKELGKGQEDIKFGEKIFKCEWKETETTFEWSEKKFVTKTKTWTCKDMPGGTVKSETSTSSGDENAPKSVTKMEVVEVKLSD